MLPASIPIALLPGNTLLIVYIPSANFKPPASILFTILSCVDSDSSNFSSSLFIVSLAFSIISFIGLSSITFSCSFTTTLFSVSLTSLLFSTLLYMLSIVVLLVVLASIIPEA